MVFLRYSKTFFSKTVFFWLVLSAIPLSVLGQLKTSRIFSDNMVLQRDIEVPVWGWSNAHAHVTLSFMGMDYHTKTDENGHWQVTLPEQKAGGPFVMVIRTKTDEIRYSNVMVGDVWLCSGQSNMEWTVANSNDAKQEIKDGNHPKIRHFKVPRSSAMAPQEQLAGGEWEVASPKTVGDFTAVGYFFAKHIQKNEEVPLGLLNSSWGGSRIEPWMSAEALGYQDIGEMMSRLKTKREKEQTEFISHLKSKLGIIPEEDLGMQDEKALWAEKELDDSLWDTMRLPSLWENSGWQKTDGIFWFRKSFSLSKGTETTDALLSLGPIDDSDQTWVNGKLVGNMEQAYNKNRVYHVPSKYLKEGNNTLTVRVDDTGGGGGIYGTPDLLFLEINGEKIPLHGDWKYRVGMVRLNNSAQSDNQQPTLLYNKMIHPILKFPIKGVLWYQGESNAGNAEDAKNYSDYFKTMIRSWRELWNIGNFPFLYVQLANFMNAKEKPSSSNWALLRESQNSVLKLPNTAQAVIIDIGEADDIHPRNKQEVGSRLALAAQKIAHGKDLVHSGPIYRSMKKNGGEVVLEFEHVGGGLVTRGDQSLKGFAIAGQNKEFIWADAEIVGNTVVVSSPGVIDPIAVRYAWADNPEDANLYNKEGLPASPFRTDDWEE